MTISNDTGRRLLDRSVDSLVVEIYPRDAFSEGTAMLLRAMNDACDTSVATPTTDGTASLWASKTSAGEPYVSSLRACLEIVAARAGNPLAPTVVCIKGGRSLRIRGLI